MAIELRPASQEAREAMEEAKRRWHDDLVKAEVTVGLLFASRDSDDESDEPVLKLRGYPAAAIIEITPYKGRIQGLPDCVIRVDEAEWRNLDQDERLGLMDHELEHAQLVLDAEGNVKPDRAGRPMLRCRLHDLVVGGFRSVVRRHGRKALETQHIAAIFAEYKQQFFSWADDQATPDAPPDLRSTLRTEAGTPSRPFAPAGTEPDGE